MTKRQVGSYRNGECEKKKVVRRKKTRMTRGRRERKEASGEVGRTEQEGTGKAELQEVGGEEKKHGEARERKMKGKDKREKEKRLRRGRRSVKKAKEA